MSGPSEIGGVAVSPGVRSILRCPHCGGEPGACRHGSSTDSGFLDFRHAADRSTESTALVEVHRGYDAGVSWLAALFGDEEAVERQRLTDGLCLRAGDRVLDVCCGSGAALPSLCAAVGERGSVVGVDVSPSMLELARGRSMRQSGGPAIDLLLGDARDLPFADASFEGALHVGAIGQFDRIGAALEEVTRVVRGGGRVVVCDEGVAPWLRDRDYGKRLMRHSAEFGFEPPLGLLPARAREVSLSWVLGDAFWVVAFTVGEPRRLDDSLLPP